MLKIVLITAAFLIIFTLGYWLHYLEKPYPMVLLTIHKLAALGLLIYLVRMTLEIGRSSAFPGVTLLVLISAGALFLIAILSGGFLSMERDWPAWVSMVHHGGTYLMAIATGLGLYHILT